LLVIKGVTLPTLPTPLRRRRLALAAVGALAVVAFGVIMVTTPGSAETVPLPGVPVPAEYRAFLAEAAKSCPALTPAKVAGQVMEESRFSPSSVNGRGGTGLAGLTDAAWETWRPSSGASRTDPRANIVALAHQMCDLVGQMRAANLSGDHWQLALGAFHSGVAAVKSAGGVPDAARDYVDRVERYAAWYAIQPESGSASAAASAAVVAARSAPATSPTVAATTPSPSPTALPPPRTVAPTRTPAPRATSRPPATVAPPPPSSSGALVNPEFHGCLSATKALDGTHLAVATCDGSLVQRWEPRSDGTIRSVGLCMDAANAGTADWTPVQVAVCSGNPAQLFTLNQDQHIYSPYADKCVNIHSVPGEGTSVVLHSCLNQTNQIFTLEPQ
jgi:hypothetical protein